MLSFPEHLRYPENPSSSSKIWPISRAVFLGFYFTQPVLAVESWDWIPFSQNRDFGLSEDWNFSKKIMLDHEIATGFWKFIPLSRAVLKEILKTQNILNKIFFEEVVPKIKIFMKSIGSEKWWIGYFLLFFCENINLWLKKIIKIYDAGQKIHQECRGKILLENFKQL